MATPEDDERLAAREEEISGKRTTGRVVEGLGWFLTAVAIFGGAVQLAHGDFTSETVTQEPIVLFEDVAGELALMAGAAACFRTGNRIERRLIVLEQQDFDDRQAIIAREHAVRLCDSFVDGVFETVEHHAEANQPSTLPNCTPPEAEL